VVENAYRKVHGRGLIASLGAQASPAAVPTPSYDGLTREQLRDEAEKRGLAKSGSKADLIERLEDYDR